MKMRVGVQALGAGVMTLCLMAAPALAQTKAAPTNRAEALAAIDKFYADEAAAHPIGGLTVGVVDHGKLIWTKSYGFADMEAHVPATRETVYRIGSITKQFTAIALLQLVQQGKVGLDDLAVKYLPELKTVQNFGDAAGSVTLLSLATHRAGLTREPDNPRFVTGPIDSWQATLREALGHTTEAFRPNDQANYSNIGYGALGLALETASGAPYIDLVEGGIVKPLGMTSTGFRPDAAMRGRLANGYSVRGSVVDASTSQAELASGRGYKIPNGGLFTTVDDMAKFLAFEMGYGPGAVLPPATLAANFQRSYPMRGSGDRYGVGFEVTQVADATLVGHGGAVAGYSANAFFDPASQIGIVCLRNSNDPCLFKASFLLAVAGLRADAGH